VAGLALAASGKIGIADLTWWRGGLTVPIYLPLRGLVNGHLLDGPGTKETLWKLLEQELASTGLEGATTGLHACSGGGLLWVLDGLDELQYLALDWTLAAIRDLAASRPDDGLVVLSRTEPACRAGPGLPDLARARIVSLDERLEVGLHPRYVDGPQVERWITTWYERAAAAGLMSQPAALHAASGLQTAVRDPLIRPMAANPLLLAKMVLFQAQRDPLPENLAVFCREAARLLLWRWPQNRLGYDVPSRHPVSPQHLEGALEWCADVIRRKGELVDGRKGISKDDLLAELTPLMFGKPGVAEATVDVLARRGGLLEEGPARRYGFVFQALLEHLGRAAGA